METRSVGIVINLAVLTAYTVGGVWRGYHRRRAHWTRGSWVGLSLVVLAGIALIGCAYAVTAAIDHQAAWVGTRGSNTRNGWIVLSIGSMVSGTLFVFGSLRWFATGKRTRQFPLLGTRGAVPALSTPHSERVPVSSANREVQPFEKS